MSKRTEIIEAVPWGFTPVSGNAIACTGATDLASRAKRARGLFLYDLGAHDSVTAYPVVRGITSNSSNNTGDDTLWAGGSLRELTRSIGLGLPAPDTTS